MVIEFFAPRTRSNGGLYLLVFFCLLAGKHSKEVSKGKSLLLASPSGRFWPCFSSQQRQGVFTTWVTCEGHVPFPLSYLVATGGLWCSIVGRLFSNDGACVTHAVFGDDFSSVGSSVFGCFFCFFFLLVPWQFALWLLTWSLLFAQNVWPYPSSRKVIHYRRCIILFG